MLLFGGDPRIVYLKILLEINKLYVIILFFVFLCLLLLRTSDQTFIFTFIVFSIVEFFRLILASGYNHGNIPLFFVFMILTAIPLLFLDFLWVFYVKTRTGFDCIVIACTTLFHVVELFVLSIYQCVRFTQYQNSFFQFSYAPEID
ncbi:hypothetical protein M9Y10_028140 [Tritrichomonas musculus]|uniref:Uncharacterized protein n=1 Tax=Tritrichomonas musculus TaxID=1915356 RepID=A0ABR2KIH3_9EUKA